MNRQKIDRFLLLDKNHLIDGFPINFLASLAINPEGYAREFQGHPSHTLFDQHNLISHPPIHPSLNHFTISNLFKYLYHFSNINQIANKQKNPIDHLLLNLKKNKIKKISCNHQSISVNDSRNEE